MRISRKIAAIVVLSVCAGVVAGCASGGNAAKKDVKSTLKVMYYDERSFYQQYGMLLAAVHPEVEIEVVSTQNLYGDGKEKDMKKAMEDFIANEKPDILMLSPDEYTAKASEGKLYNLESLIKKDKYDLEGIVPGAIDYLKGLSDGVLYGMSPNFYSQAIYYNKDMFEKYGVTLPKDKMSWEELLQLAARFPTTGSKEDRVYGLKTGYQTQLYYFGLNIGSSQGLSYINPKAKQLMINSDSWKAAFEMADKAIKSGSLYMENQNGMSNGTTYEDYLLSDPFIGGKVAMTMDGNYLMNQITEAQARLKGKGVQNWDLVTVPVNPQKPDESTGMSMSQIFAIDANSPNVEAAWKFLGYVNGDDFARVTSKLQNGGFPIRTKYLEGGEGGHHMEAFYSLKPAQNNMYKDFDKLPQEFFMKFDGLTQQVMQGVTDGKTTVSEALDDLQAKGQQLLTEESVKEDKAPAASSETKADTPVVTEEQTDSASASAVASN